MVATNGFPSQTTGGSGLFNGASSVGLIQGTAFPDPATRNWLRQGIVSQSETVPMWGGIGVYADVSPISTTGPRQPLGQVLGRATALTGSTSLMGFTVFDQAYNMVSDPNNPVSTAGSGQSINYYPLGSRARIAVKAAASLVNLRGGPLNAQVSWDFSAQELIPYSPTYAQATISAASWANTSGGQISFTVGTDLTADLNAGDIIEVTTVVYTGGTGGNFNGQWVVVSVDSTHVVVAAPATAGFFGTYSSGGVINAGGGALAVTILDIQPQGCMTVNPTGGVYTWNFSDACAVIQLTGGTVA